MSVADLCLFLGVLFTFGTFLLKLLEAAARKDK